jgi:hypothetical protein
MGAALYDYATFVKLVANALEPVGTDCLTGGAIAVCA